MMDTWKGRQLRAVFLSAENRLSCMNVAAATAFRRRVEYVSLLKSERLFEAGEIPVSSYNVVACIGIRRRRASSLTVRCAAPSSACGTFPRAAADSRHAARSVEKVAARNRTLKTHKNGNVIGLG